MQETFAKIDTVGEELALGPADEFLEATQPSVSWGAVLAGAFITAAIAIMLTAFGSGLGFAVLSPFPNAGTSLTTFGVMAAIWLVVVQWVSSGIGGYVAGRLRIRSPGFHPDEVHFRDTAHGLLVWSVAAVIVVGVALFATATGLTRATDVASGLAQGADQSASAPSAYLLDTLFRSDRPTADPGDQAARAEAGRIIANGLRNGDIPSGDRSYLAQLIESRTGLQQPEAQRRVDDIIAQARSAADTARKAASAFAFYTFASMLIGAFIAAVAAALGGHQRDEAQSLAAPA